MHYPLTYPKPSITVFIKAWLAEHLERFKGKVFDWLISDLVRSFEKVRIIYSAKIEQIPHLSKPAAEFKLLKLKDSMKAYEKLDTIVSEVKAPELQKSFKSLKMACYTYEAKLRIHVNKDAEIIATPEYIKAGISHMGKRSLSQNTAA